MCKENFNNNKENNRNNNTKHNKLNLVYKIFVVLGIIAIILLIIFKPCNCHCNCNTTTTATVQHETIGYDENISDDESSTISVDDLNKKVEQGMITMSMNTNPVFENGSAAGNLNLLNDESNNYPIMVEIKTKDNEQTIYKSGLISVGKVIKSAALNVPLEKGTYPCIAYFNNMDETTGEVLGTGAVEIEIVVKN